MFSLEEYLDSQKIAEADQVRTDAFDQICDLVADAFEEEWSKADESNKSMRLEREKRAIMGYEDEHELYIEQIREILKKKDNGAQDLDGGCQEIGGVEAGAGQGDLGGHRNHGQVEAGSCQGTDQCRRRRFQGGRAGHLQ